MKIRMLKQAFGSETGAVTRSYDAGEVYDLGHSPGAVDLAAVFVREGWAEPVLEEKSAMPPENKAIAAAPRNKGRK